MGAMIIAYVYGETPAGARSFHDMELTRSRSLLALLGWNPESRTDAHTRGFPEEARDLMLADGNSDLDDPDEWVVRSWLTVDELQPIYDEYTQENGIWEQFNFVLTHMKDLEWCGYKGVKFIYGLC